MLLKNSQKAIENRFSGSKGCPANPAVKDF